MKRICKDCGKNCYSTFAAAVGSALKASRERGVALRPYREHGTWHLTRKPEWVDDFRRGGGEVA